MVQKKVPMRRCVGCMESKPKKQLVRVVKNAAGEISMDLVGKKPGRGAYVCPDPACLAKAQKKKALERALETEIPEAVYAALRQQRAAALPVAGAGPCRRSTKKPPPRRSPRRPRRCTRHFRCAARPASW